MEPLPDVVGDILVCPTCGSKLEKSETGFDCPTDNIHYSTNATRQFDMRLQQQKSYRLHYPVPTPLSLDQFDFKWYEANPNPVHELNFDALPYQWRWGNRFTEALLTYLPKATHHDALMLDLGCGDGSARAILEGSGFGYIGIDYDSSNAPMLADAHALPFADASFDLVVSISAIEHFQYPHVVIQEVARVLKPGGKFMGTCAFLEPFHENSYHHFTLLGLWNLLRYGGFQIEHLAPHPTWTGLYALTTMALLPQMPRGIARFLTTPLELIHRAWWKLAFHLRPSPERHENTRRHRATGGFGFSCMKPS